MLGYAPFVKARSPVRTVAPATEPITTAEAKLFLHLDADFTDEDTLILSLIKSGVDRCERVTGRALITQTWRATLDYFADVIELPYPPLISVSGIAYDDTNGAAQTASSSLYTVDADSLPGRIRLAYDQDWPDTRDYPGAVRITYVAGYGAAAAVPSEIKDQLKKYVALCYRFRDEEDALDEKTLDGIFQGFWSGSY